MIRHFGLQFDNRFAVNPCIVGTMIAFALRISAVRTVALLSAFEIT